LKQSPKNYNRIVIKLGSSLLCSDKSKLDCGLVSQFTKQVADLIKQGKEVVIVSSGAIALGMHVLKQSSRPKELAQLQAVAAIGQPVLMEAFQRFFKERQLSCAQILLTRDDFDDRRRYLNAKNTLLTLLKMGSVPVINENDTVATDEIKFGDNDKLSALVALLVGADLLIILSDVDGLLDMGKKKLIKVVEDITPQIKEMACPTDKSTCVGGMITKLEAAAISVGASIPCIIANGRKKSVINECINHPQDAGTLFLPGKETLAAKERWIAFGTKPRGKIIVDEGAKKALLLKKSLLSVGIIQAEGTFAVGDIVSLCDKDKEEFGRGKVRLSSKELEKVSGKRAEKEIIHSNEIVIIN
jgi:glutamate 5-kinase